MAELDPEVKRSLKATATLSIAEAFTDGQLSVSETSYPFARILEFLDSKICALCASVRGKVLRKDSDEFKKWRLPSHINCRRTISHLREGDVDFVEPDPELIRKHGHYHLDPNKHAELRVPAQPAGRNFIRRRVKNLETGEVGVALDWAPWWEQVPAWKRDLVLQARGTTSTDELRGILAKLGILDPTDPDQLRQAIHLCLEDRLKGFLTTDESGPEDDDPPPTSGLEKIDERLRELKGDSLSLWADSRKRRRLLQNLSAAVKVDDRESIQSIADRIDRAVVEGMDALGFPRGPVLRISVRSADWAGAKLPSCELEIGEEWILDRTRQGRKPDTIWRTWVHESIHARTPFGRAALEEYWAYKGYEEGLVQGLATWICRDAAGMSVTIGSYKHYIESYRALAEILKLDELELYRELWKYGPGRVRANFGRAIDDLLKRGGLDPLTEAQKHHLFGEGEAADDLFDASRVKDKVAPARIRERWRRALQEP